MARLKGGHVIVTARAANFPAAIAQARTRRARRGRGDRHSSWSARRAIASEAQTTTRTRRARLARELGGLALGLEQAGAYIATERIGFARYLKLWRESRQKVLDWFDPTLMSYAHDTGLAATWATSVARLSPESRRLLDRLAMLAPDPIPDSLLDVAVPGEAADYDAHKARAGLYAYSLDRARDGEDGAAKGFVIHRLVQDFARRAMTEERRGEALREALGWVNAAFVGEPQDVRSWPVLDPLAPHALAVARRADEAGIAEPTGRLFIMFAVLLLCEGAFRRGRAALRRALAIVEASYGPDHPDVAAGLNNLAVLLSDHKPPRARPSRSIAARWRSTKRATGRITRGGGTPQQSRGLASRLRTASARPSRSFAARWRSRRKAMGQITPAWRTHSTISRCCSKPRTASPRRSRSCRRALAIGEESYGPDHPNVAESLNNLARLLEATNRLGEAEPLFRRALAIDEPSFGPDHPDVALRPQQSRGPACDHEPPRRGRAALVAARSRSTKRVSGRTIPRWRPASTISRASL